MTGRVLQSVLVIIWGLQSVGPPMPNVIIHNVIRVAIWWLGWRWLFRTNNPWFDQCTLSFNDKGKVQKTNKCQLLPNIHTSAIKTNIFSVFFSKWPWKSLKNEKDPTRPSWGNVEKKLWRASRGLDSTPCGQDTIQYSFLFQFLW